MKLTTKKSIDLYKHLSPKQLAALTIAGFADRNLDEVDRVRSAVPWREYRCIDAAYTDWRDAFHSVVLVWSVEYWRQMFIYASSCSHLQSELRADVDQLVYGFDASIEQLQQHTARQLALSKVLYDLCNAHGFDYDAVLKVSGAPDRCNPLDAGDIDEAFYSQWYQDLTECLPHG